WRCWMWRLKLLDGAGSCPPGRAGESLSFIVVGTRMSPRVGDVEVLKSGEVRVHRVVCAVDCGTVVNPDTVKAQ
ncbi:MAG TPA: hypothetical protein VGJ36_01760, partial [Gemmatimonadales bacterium]